MTFKRKDEVTDIARQVKSRQQEPSPELEPDLGSFDMGNLIPSGSVLLNLACSNTPNGAFGKGKVINIIGDPSAGKTWEALTVCAEMCQDIKWDDYEFYNDEPEAGNSIDIRRHFGNRLADRMLSPYYDEDGEPMGSETVLQFHMTIDKLLDKEVPFVYILDSLDSLTTHEELKETEDTFKAEEKGAKSKGSYGMSKAKAMSRMFRQIVRKIKKTGSLLIVLSQTRDNVNGGMFSPAKTVCGGSALEFYCAHRIWLDKMDHIKAHDRDIGVHTRARVSKNKISGKRRNVDFTIYNDYGIDDIGSCVDFMLDEGLLSPPKGDKKKQDEERAKKTSKRTRPKIIDAAILGYDKPIDYDSLIASIDEYPEVRRSMVELVSKRWLEIEEEIRLKREPKYQ